MAKDRGKPGRRVRVQVGDVRLSVRLADADADDSSRLPFPGWLAVSATEEAVLKLLLEKTALSREQIALALDESVDGRLRGVLATLHARKILAIGDNGYELAIPARGKERLRKWLAVLESDRRGTDGGESP
jgi:hypothetical protein